MKLKLVLLPPIVWLMTVGVMLALYKTVPGLVWLPSPLNWLGIVPIVGGLAIANWHARLFRRLGTNIDTFGEPGQLVTSGLFRRTRNPIYLGMLLSLLGVACVLGSVSPLVGPAFFFTLAHFWYIPIEERAMIKKFNGAYAEYRADVGRWL